ncbi:lipoprotein N-acyltransferase Lnb domain-containing protein [Tenacibaculum aestuarii]|uniref:lipoprotein N-acyltransferase Lnb domain-containing protein n=1 Tax=Tenacibaculum aestuarii TaxID=362781 RepID=UPI0038B48F4B
MIKKFAFILLTLLSITLGISQNTNTLTLSKFSRISVITSGPGEALYEKFGHTAVRVKDPVLQLDLIYNYGIFDFEDPNFYINFTKGFMKYKLARYPFYLSLKSAQQDGRWVKEQVLNLTQLQKNEFFNFLENNALPENASYFYDPFFDNCATRPRDIIQKVVGDSLLFKGDFVSENLSLRQLMNKEINPNTWGSFGINIALGSKLDKPATPSEYLYLPDYVFEALKVSRIIKGDKEENLVQKTNILLDFEEKKSKSDAFSPFLAIVLFFLLGLFITYKDIKNSKRTKWLDFTLFFTTGILGFLIVFLWFFTNHSTAPNNFNFLWAFAPNTVVAFFLLKKEPPMWIRKYCLVLLAFLLLIPVVWLTKIQLYTYPIIPLFILLGIRYWYLQKTFKR